MRKVWKWICRQWISLLFGLPGVDFGDEVEERRKMAAVHLNVKNWEKIRGNFHAYFAKYLGKAEEKMVAENPIPGRWWGKWNGAALPRGEHKELVLPARVAVHCHRVARRIRQERADDSKHRQICRKIHAWNVSTNQPLVSRQQVNAMASRIKRGGSVLTVDDVTPAEFLAFWAIAEAAKQGLRFGRYEFKRHAAFCAVTLIGSHVPAMLVQVLQYAGNRAREDLDNNPF
jgi:hypothetical protein